EGSLKENSGSSNDTLSKKDSSKIMSASDEKRLKIIITSLENKLNDTKQIIEKICRKKEDSINTFDYFKEMSQHTFITGVVTVKSKITSILSNDQQSKDLTNPTIEEEKSIIKLKSNVLGPETHELTLENIKLQILNATKNTFNSKSWSSDKKSHDKPKSISCDNDEQVAGNINVTESNIADEEQNVKTLLMIVDYIQKLEAKFDKNSENILDLNQSINDQRVRLEREE
ncbi:MAG: hypothetical protein MHPSP_002480, partial [Paramarteilia canceri]